MAVPDRSDPRFEYERQLAGRGIGRIAGVDEAGRGPLAGPVAVAAVVFPPEWYDQGLPAALRGLNDSKQLSERRRESYFEVLTRSPEVAWHICLVDSGEIDSLNILRATHAGMIRSLTALRPNPEHALVDGLEVASLPVPQTALVKGDSRSYSIAAASVLAKVTRDRLMLEYDRRWPEYGFAQHKGYPTAAHLTALNRHGPCPIHRRSFAPVAAARAQLDLFRP